MASDGAGSARVHYLPGAEGSHAHRCDACGTAFTLRFAFQQVALGAELRHVCSQPCREQVLANVQRGGARARPCMRIAIMNQKGGTGKTTTAVNLASGLAAAGKRVLLIDLDAQGHVGISLGVRGQRTLYHVMVEGVDPRECVVPLDNHLDLITSNETLASLEIFLARMNEGRERLLRKRLAELEGYDFILLDCGPSKSLLNLNALAFADNLLVPVTCDFLSLVGVRQVMKTVRQVNELLLHPIEILGVLPTFYDQRNRISDESVKSLRARFAQKVLPPVRVNTRLKEAPSHRQSIFDYAPHSRGANDYRRLTRWVLDRAEEAATRQESRG